MVYGSEFYNDGLKLQIATGVSNYFMVQKGTGSMANAIWFDVAPTVAYDAIAVVMSSTTVSVVPKSIFPSVQAASTSQRFRTINGAISTGYSWFAFRTYQSLTPSSSGYGLEMYNSDGTVGFSSTQPMILKGLKIPLTSSTTVNTTVSSSKTYAFLKYGTVNKNVTYTEAMSGDLVTGSADLHVLRSSTTNIAVAINTRTSKSSAGAESYQGGVIAADVTNY
jgi:hypothetical protein